jgi:hypothetical protein
MSISRMSRGVGMKLVTNYLVMRGQHEPYSCSHHLNGSRSELVHHQRHSGDSSAGQLMTHAQEIGFIVSALVLAAFGIRIVAICSNFAFIVYALLLHLLPVLVHNRVACSGLALRAIGCGCGNRQRLAGG